MLDHGLGIVGEMTGLAGFDFEASQWDDMAFPTHEATSLGDRFVRIKREPGALMGEALDRCIGQRTLGAMVIGVAAQAVAWVSEAEMEGALIVQLRAGAHMAVEAAITHESPRPESGMTGGAVALELGMSKYAANGLNRRLGVELTGAKDLLIRSDGCDRDQRSRN
jgi:hypothetical protein